MGDEAWQVYQGCGVLQPVTLSDDAILLLCRLYVVESLSYRRCFAFFRAVLLPVLQNLQRPASRVLLCAVLEAAQCQGGCVIDAVLLPLLAHPSCGTPHTELITRLLREPLPDAIKLRFLRQLLSLRAVKTASSVSELDWEQSISEVCWTELTVQLVLNALQGGQLPLDESLMALLVPTLADQVASFHAALKFSQLVLTVISKYTRLAAAHKATFLQIANQLTTFMKKSILQQASNLT
eukprot:TRINITY_DN17829_c0_g2_i2.p1 TRINITY_DN17829_c0_g2~~TRINITY_DN17829_c0_g2_i2.p1  ORF type:complete len:246 (-),score=58.46 TRINITY_DN17829_c0_g2_i2:373-1086(-)